MPSSRPCLPTLTGGASGPSRPARPRLSNDCVRHLGTTRAKARVRPALMARYHAGKWPHLGPGLTGGTQHLGEPHFLRGSSPSLGILPFEACQNAVPKVNNERFVRLPSNLPCGADAGEDRHEEKYRQLGELAIRCQVPFYENFKLHNVGWSLRVSEYCTIVITCWVISAMVEVNYCAAGPNVFRRRVTMTKLMWCLVAQQKILQLGDIA